MKKYILLLIFVSIIFTGFAQDGTKKIPAINIYTLSGDTVNTASFFDGENPVIISFWSTWCKYCIKELDAFSALNKSWKKETGVRIIAIAVESKKESIINMVNRKNWDLEIYIDESGKLAHTLMGERISLPKLYLLDKNLTIVYSHYGFNKKVTNELYQNLINKL